MRHLCASHHQWVVRDPSGPLHRDDARPCDAAWFVDEHGRRRTYEWMFADHTEEEPCPS
jgi:hypothetical protein